MKWLWKAANWVVPSIVCLAVYWHGFRSWFRADDFAWLSLGGRVHSFGDLLDALFSPRAQGTMRPWSERAFFMAGYSLFGLDAVPFRVAIFATQFANLALMASAGARLSGSRAAGFWAAMLWAVNSGLADTLGWTSVYNEVLCGFFLLLAFYSLLRYLETGRRSYNVAQWIAFLLGFGALELMAVYPVLAAGYTWLCARKHFRRTLPLFVPSVVFAVAHRIAAPLPQSGPYVMHWDGSVFRTFVKLWSWSVASVHLLNPHVTVRWLAPAGAVLLTAGLAGFLAWRGRHALFCVLWYAAVVAPLLPLRDHVVEYYVYLPVIGLCWLGGWALVTAWRAGAAAKVAAMALAALYVFLTLPQGRAISRYDRLRTERARNLVEGMAGAHELHPREAILLDGVDAELFASAIADHPFRLMGFDDVYVAPAGGQEADPRIREFILPPDAVARALANRALVVYDARGPRLRNVTAEWSASPRQGKLPLRVDVGNPLDADLLGPEWYPSEGDHRWMPKRATLRMAAPAAAGQQLYLQGNCSSAQVRAGPLAVTVTAGGTKLPAASLSSCEKSFELAFPLPPSVVGQPEMKLEIEVDRTFRPPSDQRELGLAFGTFEVRKPE